MGGERQEGGGAVGALLVELQTGGLKNGDLKTKNSGVKKVGGFKRWCCFLKLTIVFYSICNYSVL